MNLTSKLDAVNSILATCGEAPVNTLTGDLPLDAAMAKNKLDEAIRDIQTEGWYFNTEVAYPLTRDGQGLLHVPSNTIRVSFDTTCTTTRPPVMRGTALYDAEKHTYVWTADKKVKEIVFMLDFELLPEAARKYSYFKAARRYQAQNLTNQALLNVTFTDEQMAKRDLMVEDAEARQANIFNNPDTQNILAR